MGCFHSTPTGPRPSERDSYVEMLTLKRRVTKKVNGQNVKISISVISDPYSSLEDMARASDTRHGEQYFELNSGVKHRKRRSHRTLSYAEGRRFTKFPNHVGYKMCLDCHEHKQDVRKTMVHQGDKELCRACSVKNRPTRKKSETPVQTGLDITSFAQLLALTALDLTAPANDAIFKNRKNVWIQLAGHPGAFAPAGPHTIWKKRYTKDNNETRAYEALMEDSAHNIVPMFYREVEYNSEYFIEMEDLLQHFTDPNIMDVKMGSRTFLESEVTNPVLRQDLYDKMVTLDSSAATAEEKEAQAITKMRYMQFRETESSTSEYGFRIEALRISGEPITTNLKKVKTKEQIKNIFVKFIDGSKNVQSYLMRRLEEIREKFEESPYFMTHEIIGSSILLMFDKNEKCGAWMIDFSKTIPVTGGLTITHRSQWQLGNHEDGFLFGLDNLILLLSDLDLKSDAVTSSSTPTPSSQSSIEET